MRTVPLPIVAWPMLLKATSLNVQAVIHCSHLVQSLSQAYVVQMRMMVVVMMMRVLWQSDASSESETKCWQ
jgi:hypothetical protein